MEPSIAQGGSRKSESPTVVLRISDGEWQSRRAFSDFGQACRSAEAYAGAGFSVDMVSVTGRYLMGFAPPGPTPTA